MSISHREGRDSDGCGSMCLGLALDSFEMMMTPRLGKHRGLHLSSASNNWLVSARKSPLGKPAKQTPPTLQPKTDGGA